jgi:hypothetical protein
MKPSLAFSNVKGYGLIRLPLQGYASNVSEGTGPGQINGIGTGAASLNADRYGEIAIGNGITGSTNITTLTGLRPRSFLVIRNAQTTHSVVLSGSAFGLANGLAVTIGSSQANGATITLWVDGTGNPHEVGRSFIVSGGVYTVTNPSTDRSLNVSADTTAQVAAVLGTLIADLQGRGILS